MAVRVSCEGCGATIAIVRAGEYDDSAISAAFRQHKRERHRLDGWMPLLVIIAAVLFAWWVL